MSTKKSERQSKPAEVKEELQYTARCEPELQNIQKLEYMLKPAGPVAAT